VSTPPTVDRRVTVEGGSYVTTPRVRTTARRIAFWVGVLVFILILTLVVLAIRGSGSVGDPLSATNSAPAGAKGLVQVLRQDGVTVKTPRTLDAAANAVTSPANTTVALYDPNGYLTREQLDRVNLLATRIVLIEPSFTALKAIAPEVANAGIAITPLSADCDYGPAKKAGTVDTGSVTNSSAYRVVADAANATTCFGEDDAYSLVRITRGADTITVLGLPDALSNGSIVKSGNAALALGVFGETDTLVWYLPSADDLAVDPSAPAIQFPDWVNPAIALLVLVALAGAFWRGRRFGPLVIERMPVVVRSSETMEGRARLYQRASSRTHALDALRLGTTTEIVDAASAVTGRHATEVRGILVDEIPRTDSQLLRLSDALIALERDVASGSRPG
jgi:hypothetical protein